MQVHAWRSELSILALPSSLHCCKHWQSKHPSAEPKKRVRGLQASESRNNSSVRGASTALTDTINAPAGIAGGSVPAPRPQSSEAEIAAQPVLDDIEAGIDDILSASRELWFADSYHLQSGRVRGCTTIIQEAYDPHTEVPLVCKFFTNHHQFESYVATQSHPAIAVTMPSRHRAFANEEGFYGSPGGYSFPPFVFLERGFTLEQWRLAPHAPQEVYGMLFDVANALMTLHGQQRVHRRLSPRSLLWCGASGAWRLLHVDHCDEVGARSPCWTT